MCQLPRLLLYELSLKLVSQQFYLHFLMDENLFSFRNNGRPNRLNNQERSDNRMNYDRNNSANHNRTSPRHHDNSQMSPTPYASRNRGENNNHSHGSSAPPQGHNNLDTNNSSISSRQSDGLPPAQRWVNFPCH